MVDGHFHVDRGDENIVFADALTQEIASEYFGSNGNVTYRQALAATSFPEMIEKRYFYNSKISSFDELKYFKNITWIRDHMFGICKYLQSISLPKKLKSLGTGVFYGCESLKSIELPNTLEFIGEACFFTCRSIKLIEIPKSVNMIEGSAFADSTSLRTVISRAITPPQMDDNVFNNTHSYLKIYVPDESIKKYKAADGWYFYADKIVGISDLE